MPCPQRPSVAQAGVAPAAEVALGPRVVVRDEAAGQGKLEPLGGHLHAAHPGAGHACLPCGGVRRADCSRAQARPFCDHHLAAGGLLMPEKLTLTDRDTLSRDQQARALQPFAQLSGAIRGREPRAIAAMEVPVRTS
jgi:hypothetical protein